jgi:isopentenyl-diphosphate Delta-isomerase
MSTPYEGFEARKREHITHALNPHTQTHAADLLDFQLIHEALPDLNFEDIKIESKRFNQTVATPFIISSMTAGHHDAKVLNFTLAKACSTLDWAMGVGSQRRELTDPHAKTEWQTLRQTFPTLSLFGNLGISQLIESSIDDIRRLVDNIEAQAMIIHTNPLQECLQLEGTPDFRGSFQALEQLCTTLGCPVILKETGCGFSPHTLQRLHNIGLAAVDLSGFGGTHWGRIEGLRNEAYSMQAQAANTFKDWGISTFDSLIAARKSNYDYELWGSGGIRSGLDAAKLLALGATTIGFAKPLLEAALQGIDPLIKKMKSYHHELKIALFCTGSKDIVSLQEKHRDLIP